ncbi:TOX high mobility group box family member 4-like [Homalodisca vitripennis]|uniref:TOX high mobility group box family member 4-like n=1 Tax=Homalodisca vitripennis TaxID=197043 RepID=UPI001EEC63B3|nr:TOX high mobility group box family member 4-like [Homalodisca vitripennis]
MEATYCMGTDVDVCRMFDQYLYKRNDNLDLSCSVSQGIHNSYGMTDQTFHTPSFGDEDFDIPPINPHQNHPQANMGYHQQPPMSMSMSQTTDSLSMSDPNGYHQQNHSMYQDHSMGLSVSASYSSPPPPGQPNYSHSQMQMVQPQHYNMGPPFGRSPQGHSPPGAPHPHHETTTTSDDSDDSTPHTQLLAGMKRPSPEPADTSLAKIQKKPKAQKKKKKRDPNEPQKPVSAYALFFRDTQAAIKGQNPNASFGEVSKIVASMWDALDTEHKNVYKKKTEAAKKDYLKALAAYRASLVSKGAGEQDNMYGAYGGYGGGYSGYSPPTGLPSPPMPAPSPQQMTTLTNMNKKPHMMADNRATNQQQQQQHSQQGMMGGHMGQQQQLPQQQQQPSQQPQTNNIGSNYMQQQQGGGGSEPQQSVSHPLNNNNHPLQCIRHGCPNPATTNPEWEDEYCSNECVVTHCRDVFNSWVASSQSGPSVT